MQYLWINFDTKLYIKDMLSTNYCSFTIQFVRVGLPSLDLDIPLSFDELHLYDCVWNQNVRKTSFEIRFVNF